MSTPTTILTVTELAAELHVSPTVVDVLVYSAPLPGELFADVDRDPVDHYVDAYGITCRDVALAPEVAAYVREQLGKA